MLSLKLNGMPSFFEDHTHNVIFPDPQETSSTEYRQCQEGAYWAIKAHRTTKRSSPAVVSLPTGGGKTAVMMLSAFEYRVNRVLIIVPSDALRSQIASRFENLTGLSKADAFAADTDDLVVHTHDGRAAAEADWEAHTDADVVVATPHSISEKYANSDEDPVVSPPDGFFDLLMVDEAHHTPAPGWRTVLDSFSSLPQLLFTATPFRREDESLPGELIYHYPIEQAREASIYHEVGLNTVSGSDSELIEKATRTLESLQTENGKATLLARTDKISNVEDLLRQYRDETSLELRPVHSDTDNSHETIQCLRDGEIDGVIVVDKFAEGIDVANLQVAVFHEPPKSFPRMIQIIGRLARKPDSGGKAKIIATEETVESRSMSRAVRQLYLDDSGWARLADELMSNYLPDRRSDSTGATSTLDAVSSENIRPYKTVTVYALNETVFEPVENTEFVIDGVDCIPDRVIQTPDQMWGCITTTQESPTWGTDTILQSETYDLHLYCAPEGSDLLFEYTSDAGSATQIRKTLIHNEDDLSQVKGRRLSKAMQSLSSPKFRVAGMNNVLVPTGTQPQYKTLTGTDVQGAIYHSDTRRYTRGHLFASFDSDGEASDIETSEDYSSSSSNTRGISSATGTIWSNSKGQLAEFRQWCLTLSQKLSADRESTAGHLQSLNEGNKVSTFENTPMFMLPDIKVAKRGIEFSGPSTDGWEQIKLEIDIQESIDAPTSAVGVNVSGTSVDVDIQCTYKIDQNEWCGEITDYQFRVPDTRTYSELSGGQFLNEYPPRFYIDSNTIVIGGVEYAAETTLDGFDTSSLTTSIQPDWSEYIDEEATEKPDWTLPGPSDDARSVWEEKPTETVFSAVVEILISEYGGEEYVLFCGDEGNKGSEIADFIDFRREEQQITLYHCKRSHSPGIRVDYFKDIYHQTLRSLRYTYNQELVDSIDEDRGGDTKAHIICGDDAFDEIVDSFVPTEWNYTICGIHPGLKVAFDAESDNKNVGRLLSECTEQVERNGVDFAMIGAGDSWEE